MKSKPTDTWAAHFVAAISSKEKLPPGDGWLTFEEFCKKAQICEMRGRRYIRGCTVAKTMEVFNGFRVIGAKARRCVWYRPVT